MKLEEVSGLTRWLRIDLHGTFALPVKCQLVRQMLEWE